MNDAEEDAALGPGWAKTPAAFDAYRGPRPSRTAEQSPVKWVDEWLVPGLTAVHRNKIRAQLLRADSTFDKSPDPDSGMLEAMKHAFDGIARVLFEGGILTSDLLRNAIPALVWDSAIAGGWWRFASETPGILPEQLGHYWVWRDDGRDWSELFRVEVREWEASLLETSSPETLVIPAPEAIASRLQPSPSQGRSTDGADRTASAESGRFASEAQRIDAVAAYTGSWLCSEAALARTARVDPADLSKWKKNLLPAESDKKARIERVLIDSQAPTTAVKRPHQL